MNKNKAFALVANHLDINKYDRGVYEKELTVGLGSNEKSNFLTSLDLLEKEGVIIKKRGLVFIGNNYESSLSLIQDNSSDNVLSHNVFNGPVQVGNSNQMTISETDILAIEKIIEKLARNDDPTLVESILNISNKAKDSYTKIKEWIGLVL